MFLDKTAERETIKILTEENKRLKRENQRLTEALDELRQHADSFNELIRHLGAVKETYKKKMTSFDSLEKEYRRELETLMNTIR